MFQKSDELYMPACLCIYRYIPEYNLLSVHQAICMHVLMTDQLVLGNQWVCSFMGKIISPILNIP